MSTVKADTVQPKDFATDLTLGASGDTVTVAADSIFVDKVQDKGGNTLWDYSTGAFVSSNPVFASQNLKLLATTEVPFEGNYSSISFTSGIDSTYSVYIFKWISIKAYVDGEEFCFQADNITGIDYAQTITSTSFTAYHTPTDSSAAINYEPAGDQAQGTAPQRLGQGQSNDADHCTNGTLYVFNPSNTTSVKHFYSTASSVESWQEASGNHFMGGYFNTTSALTKFQFKFEIGSIAEGTMKMYGLI